jgi:hypothetical protein
MAVAAVVYSPRAIYEEVAMLRIKWAAAALIAVVAVLVSVASAGAFAGSQGDQGGPAYALVNPNNGSPQLVAGHTSGFTAVAVGGAGQGDYCLTPAPGVDIAHTAAVASEEAFYSDEVGFVLVRYQPSSPNCSANQLEVKTFNSDVTALTNGIAFTVNVP